MRTLGLILLALSLSNCDGDQTNSLVTLEIESQNFEIVVPATGQLRAVKATPISSPVNVRSAQTIAWLEEEGKLVKEGDPLIAFDESDLLVREGDTMMDLETLEYTRKMDGLKHDQETDGLEGQVKILGKERVLAERFAVKDPQFHSRKDILNSEVDLQLLDQKVDHYEKKTDRHSIKGKTQQDIHDLSAKSHRLKLEQILANRKVLLIKAPHDGYFYYTRNWRNEPPKVGGNCWPGMQLGELPDLSQMEAKVHVLEKETSGLKEGLEAEIELDARPGFPYKAKVKTVAGFAKPLERESPVKYFEAVLSLEKTERAFMNPGSFVNARIFVDRQEDVIAVPNQVLFHEGEEHWVWVVKGSDVSKRSVVLGKRGPTQTVITEGLQVGEHVALSAPEKEEGS